MTRSDPAPREVHLHLDTLVLHGTGPVDRAALSAAIQAELGRLVAAGGVPEAWQTHRRTARLDGGTVAPDAPTSAVGARVAQTLYRGGTP